MAWSTRSKPFFLHSDPSCPKFTYKWISGKLREERFLLQKDRPYHVFQPQHPITCTNPLSPPFAQNLITARFLALHFFAKKLKFYKPRKTNPQGLEVVCKTKRQFYFYSKEALCNRKMPLQCRGIFLLFIQLVYEINHTQIMRANHRFPFNFRKSKVAQNNLIIRFL